jgi:hypothetical protein
VCVSVSLSLCVCVCVCVCVPLPPILAPPPPPADDTPSGVASHLSAHGRGVVVGGTGVELGQQEASLAAILVTVHQARHGEPPSQDGLRITLGCLT